MPIDELHLRLKRTKLHVRPPAEPPGDEEFELTLDVQPIELEVLRYLRECLCSAMPHHPTGKGWFDFFGRRLAARLHPDATRYFLHDRDTALRVFLEIDPPVDDDGRALRDAPWELLRFAAGRGTEAVLGTSPKLSVTRLLPVDATHARLGPVFKDNLRVLLIDASTAAGADLAGEQVRSHIASQIQSQVELWTGKDLRACSEQLRALKRSALTDGEFDIIHILGHGRTVNDQVEIRVDDDGALSASEIAEVTAGRCRAVILQSCSTSAAAPELLRRGPEAVVAMSYDVERDPSTRFITKLYQRLAAGDPIDAAVQQGRAFLDPDGRAAPVGAPVLYARTRQPVAFRGSSRDRPAAATVGGKDEPAPAPPTRDADAVATATSSPPRKPAAPPTERPRTSLLRVRANREDA
jgi:hypothetical protein